MKLLRLGPCFLLSAPSITTPLADWVNHGKTRGNVIDRYKGNYIQTGTADQSGRTPRADAVYVTGSPQDGYELSLLNYQIDELLYAFPSAVKVTNSTEEAIGISTPNSTITPRAFALVPVADYDASTPGRWYSSVHTRFIEAGVLHITGELKGQLPDGEDILDATAYTCMVKALDDESSSNTGGIGLYRLLTYLEIDTGNTPRGVVLYDNGTKIIYINGDDNNVTILDLLDNSSSTVTVGSGPVSIKVSPDETIAIVTNSGSGNVTIIDLSDNSTVNVTTGDSPRGVDFYSDSSKAIVTNAISNNASIIDLSDNSKVDVNVGTTPREVVVNPANSKAYVTNQGSDNVTIIDLSDNSTSNVAVGDSPWGCVVSSDGDYVYISNNGDDSISVIDTSSDTVTSTITSVGDGPREIGLFENDNVLAVASSGNDKAVFLNITTEVITEVTIGDDPRGVSVYANSLAAFSCQNSDIVVLIVGIF
ncbi:MAG: beta-propeller fold lactonase family protein [Balneola sp.]